MAVVDGMSFSMTRLLKQSCRNGANAHSRRTSSSSRSSPRCNRLAGGGTCAALSFFGIMSTEAGFEAMSVTLNVPRSIENEVRYCANLRGISLSQFVFELVERVAARIRQERERQAEECIAGLDALVKATHGRLDKPYVFNRADAYEQEEG